MSVNRLVDHRSPGRFILAAMLAFLFASPPPAAARDTGFLDRTVTLAGEPYRYQVYVPRGASPRDHLPIILALHGSGERGVDGILQTEVGLANAVRRFPDRWRAVIVFAQSHPDTSWQGRSAEVALAELDHEQRAFHTDPKRVYLTGLSLGGNGTWYIAYHHPDRFAAIVPVCGFVGARGPATPPITPDADPYTAVAARIARLPVWIIHGGADSVVPVEESRRMAAALKAAGADVHYNELPGVDHASWVPGYADPALSDWLFRQHRP